MIEYDSRLGAPKAVRFKGVGTEAGAAIGIIVIRWIGRLGRNLTKWKTEKPRQGNQKITLKMPSLTTKV